MKPIKNILTIAALLAALFVALPSMAAKKEAKISFKEKIFEYGQISLKAGKVTHEFVFTNDGDDNLVITNARADCGCTRPEYNDAPVAPGASGKVKVTFAPAAKGSFTKKITITSNGNPKKTRLLIKGEVIE